MIKLARAKEPLQSITGQLFQARASNLFVELAGPVIMHPAGPIS